MNRPVFNFALKTSANCFSHICEARAPAWPSKMQYKEHRSLKFIKIERTERYLKTYKLLEETRESSTKWVSCISSRSPRFVPIAQSNGRAEIKVILKKTST